MKRLLSLLLCLALIFALLTGCKDSPEKVPTESIPATVAVSAEPDPEAASRPGTQPASDVPEGTAAHGTDPVSAPLPEIPWTKAFRTKNVPEGSVDAESVAFLHRDGDGTLTVTNVPIREILSGQPERLPRSRYYEQYMPEALTAELLPAMDYAMAHGFSRLCIPTASFTYGDIHAAASYLGWTYSVNNNGVGALDISHFPQADGSTLTFVLVTIAGMEKGQLIEQYREGVAAAEAIVDAMPEGLDERGRMLFLYQWLTDHVEYDYNDYYNEQNWCLLYDALVRHSTVCAGYTEALTVLANLAGIDCFTVVGFVNQTDQSFGHIWNVARIDGQYYQFDATWDAGLDPREYTYFGVSSDYMLAHHTKYLTAFSEQMLPPCPDSLLPDALPRSEADGPAFPVYWHYRLGNAMRSNPTQLLRYMAFDKVKAEAPADGWISTDVPYAAFLGSLTILMTPDQAARFAAEHLRADENGKLAYRVPEEAPVLERLCGLEENADGTWTARVCMIAADYSFTMRDDRITLVEQDGQWYLAGVE